MLIFFYSVLAITRAVLTYATLTKRKGRQTDELNRLTKDPDVHDSEKLRNYYKWSQQYSRILWKLVEDNGSLHQIQIYLYYLQMYICICIACDRQNQSSAGLKALPSWSTSKCCTTCCCTLYQTPALGHYAAVPGRPHYALNIVRLSIRLSVCPVQSCQPWTQNATRYNAQTFSRIAPEDWQSNVEAKRLNIKVTSGQKCENRFWRTSSWKKGIDSRKKPNQDDPRSMLHVSIQQRKCVEYTSRRNRATMFGAITRCVTRAEWVAHVETHDCTDVPFILNIMLK